MIAQQIVMNHFKPFEEDVLRLLATPVLGANTVTAILKESEFVSYEYSGAGYFVTVRHPTLPLTRTVISQPTVIGQSDEAQGGFLVFIENGELMLECYTAGTVEIPESFREQHVHVAAT